GKIFSLRWLTSFYNLGLISGGSNELLSKLLSGRLDFSLIGSVTPLVHPNLTVQLLYQREFYIFASKDNPLSQKSEISFEEAADYPFILLEEGFVHAKAFQRLNDKYDKKAQTLLHFSDVQTIGQLVKSNIGITLMTDFIPFRDMENLVKIPLVAKDKEIFYVQYAHLKTAVLNEDLQQLVVMLDKLSKVDDTCANE
ncbi:MAG: LysR substrate-binding domain-containing protein, partial [Pseudolactococcus laudensis]